MIFGFYVNLETDKKASWSPQEAEKVPTETFWDDVGPQVEIKRGPRATQNRSKTTKKRPLPLIKSYLFLLLAPLAGARGQLSRFGVDLGSIWGRCCVDLGGRCGPILGRCWVGLSVFLSVYLSVCLCLPSRHPESTANKHGLAVCAKRSNK